MLSCYFQKEYSNFVFAAKKILHSLSNFEQVLIAFQISIFFGNMRFN